jgi:hypothetical protein
MPDDRVNKIQVPVDMALKLVQDQNERISGQLLGPERPTRRQMVGDISQDVIIEAALRDMEERI